MAPPPCTRRALSAILSQDHHQALRWQVRCIYLVIYLVMHYIDAFWLIERLGEQEEPLTRVVALFALYTFHETQPSTSAPPILSVPYIVIPLGDLTSLANDLQY